MIGFRFLNADAKVWGIQDEVIGQLFVFDMLLANIVRCARQGQRGDHFFSHRVYHCGDVAPSERFADGSHFPPKAQRHEDDIVVIQKAIECDAMSGE